MRLVVFAAIVAALICASYWFAAFIGPRVGVQVRKGNVAHKRLVWVMLLYIWAAAVAVAWAFGSGHAVRGIAIMVGAYLAPDIVARTLRRKRSPDRPGDN